MTEQGIRIPSLDAKDLYISNHLINSPDSDYSLICADGTVNMNKFINTMDYSLDLIKLRQVYLSTYRKKDFSFESNGYEYSTRVINVTFKYSVKEYNMIGNDTYIKYGYRFREVPLENCVYVANGELLAIRLNTPVAMDKIVSSELLGKNFEYTNGCYQLKGLATLKNVAELREDLYKNGFYCDGVHYVRFKRSSGSSRVGKCLFIDEKLYPAMHRYEMCGIKVTPGQQIDLAALEAYIALTLSSIIDTIEISPESILIIDDYESIFTDTVIATKIKDGNLVTGEETVKIKNSIWDGESLIDVSAMGEYAQYGMILLRNFFFKSCCFNTNIQQFFSDHGITSIEQLNGFTLATDISQIKLITTPSSIKYLKFGTKKKWLRSIGTTFGVVKHEKKTHFWEGTMVQTHYQLLNTLQLSREEMKEFLQPSLDYMDLLKTDPVVFRNHVKHPGYLSNVSTDLKSTNDIVFELMGTNEEFTKTKLYRDFCNNSITAYKNNILYGHVLVEGNYSTLLGNPLEMLYQSIGQFDGSSMIGIGNVHSKRFKPGERLLGSRSPHCCVSNILLTTNIAHETIDKYFNLTEEIICINSIGENILQRLSGADFDSDTLLLTNNPLLIRAAEKNYNLFKVSTSMVESTKSIRYYTPEQQADLDIKTSVNKIGEIVNLSQELQTLMWHKLNNGASFEDVKEIYYDACQLNVMSGIEIDKAKKEFDINNENELRKLREKWIRKDYANKTIKPYFFGHVDKTKGYYNEDKKNYMKHDTSMDYLREIINNYRSPKIYSSPLPLTSIFSSAHNRSSENRRQITSILYMIEQFKNTSYYIWNGFADTKDRYQRYVEVEDALIREINTMSINTSTLYGLIKRIESKDYLNIGEFVTKLLFNIGNSTAISLIRESSEPLYVLEEDENGSIDIYGKKFKKSQKIG